MRYVFKGSTGTMKEQSYGIITSISIHTIIILLLLMLTSHKKGNELKTFYIQFTQLKEQTLWTSSSQGIMKAKVSRAIKKDVIQTQHKEEVKEVKEETSLIENPPVKEHKAEIINNAYTSYEAVNVPSASEFDLQPHTTQPLRNNIIGTYSPTSESGFQSQATQHKGGGSTVTNVSNALPSGTSGVVNREFGLVGAPTFLKRQMPIYPIRAKKLGIEGKVVLRLHIDEKGRLLDVEVVEGGGYGFTESAIEAVKKSTFSPAHINGVSVASKALLTIYFVLK